MKLKELVAKIKLQKELEVDMDGYDLAWYDGVDAVLSFCGDGGISETYISGIQYALNNLDSDAIGDFEEVDYNV